MQLTPEQETFIAAVATTNDNLRLDAVAGSGKTTTLLKAAQNIPHDKKVLALAFNKKIAEELERKLPSHIDCRTLNGLGHRVWASYQGRKKLNTRKLGNLTSDFMKKYATGLDQKEKSTLYFSILALARHLKSEGYIPEVYAEKIHVDAPAADYEAMELISINNAIKIPGSMAYDGAMKVLQQSIALAFMSEIDFDDQLYMPTYFAPQQSWPQYDIILVDESQDLSPLQHDMIDRAAPGARVIVVGDAHQAIYGWRGASVKSLDDMTDRFSLVRYPLTVSFRCPAEIVAEAQKIVPHIQHAPDNTGGTVVSLDDEFKLSDIENGAVVLCRNNAPLISLGFRFIRENRPAYFTGREIGRGLKRTCDDLDFNQSLHVAILEWGKAEIRMAREKDQHIRVEQVKDQMETLECIMKGYRATTPEELKDGIDFLFRREYSPDAVELSTIHKAKGKEWDNVYILNQSLIPGKWLVSAREDLFTSYIKDEEQGALIHNDDLYPRLSDDDAGRVRHLDGLIAQEYNLLYVAITRALTKLTYITQRSN